MARLYDVVVTDVDGTVLGEVADARVERVSWELNGTGSATVRLPTTDPDAALLIPGREVQVWLDGEILWWGPIVRPQGGLDESTWQCAELPWYFAHRFMGRADRANLLTNGDFESGETGWLFSGVTHSIDTSFHNDGAQSLKLIGGSADHATYAYQIFTHGAGGYPTGDLVTGAVWVNVRATGFLGGAANDYGLVLIHRRGATVINTDFAEIGDDTEKDKWIPLEAAVTDVIEGDTVEMRLFPPHGTAYFDTATLTYMESLSFGYPADPKDVTEIISGIVDYAQNRVFDHGKSDLNIYPDGADTGETRQVAYQFAEHRNILDAILEYVRQGICDVSVEISPTTRTFMVWPVSADTRTPKLGKGTLYGTTLELDVNISDFTFSEDLENAASTVVMLGPGDGPDRPEGNAFDPTFVGGAFTAEIVEQAPDNTTVGQLDQRAEERLKVAARPKILEVTTLPGSDIIGNLVVGDTVNVLISRGWVDIPNEIYRVVAIQADLHNDQATITLNPIP